MAKGKQFILYDLIDFINKTIEETNETIIAKTFIENRYHLDDLSLEDIANMCYISQPTISRFIKKIGYKNYNSFRNAMNLSIYRNKSFHPLQNNRSAKQIKEEVKVGIQQALDCIDTLDLDRLEKIVDIMLDYDTIVFMGSELSMSIAYKLQLGLTSLGKNVYNLYTLDYQEQMLHIIEKNDRVLMICISIEGRWIDSFEDLKNIRELPYKILWTIEDEPADAKYFDLVYHFGKPVSNDLGYNELMYFILIVYNMVMRSHS